jgi:hypothetical protein
MHTNAGRLQSLGRRGEIDVDYVTFSEDRDTQPRVSYLTEVDEESSVYFPVLSQLKLAIPSRFTKKELTASSTHVIDRPFSSPIKTRDSTTP